MHASMILGTCAFPNGREAYRIPARPEFAASLKARKQLFESRVVRCGDGEFAR